MSIDNALDGRRVAMLEEWRQARGVADISTEWEELAGGTMTFSGEASWSNQAQGQGLRGPVTDNDLDRLTAFYRERNAVPTIEVAAFADRTLVDGLRTRGYGLREFEIVYATEIAAGEECRHRMSVPLGEGIEIRRHDPGDDAADEAFVRVGMSGFVAPGEDLNPMDIEVGIRCVRHPRSVSVGAWADGRLVGSAGAELMTDAPDADGRPAPVACLFGTSVEPDYRRRGIQQALMAARLDACAAAGGGLACIHSSPEVATGRNATRMGFVPAYTKVTMVLEPEA